MAQDQLMNGLRNFQRQFPREAQMAKVEIQRMIAEGGAPDPDEIKELMQIAIDLQKNPSLWAQFRPELIEAGMDEVDLPPAKASKQEIAKVIGLLMLTIYLIGQGPEGQQQPATVAPAAPEAAGLINTSGE